jgi:YidC/Oxa1 family membrane protein insertase
MENRRFFLLAALGVILFFLYQTWQKDFAQGNTPQPAAATEPASVDAALEDQAPSALPAADVPAATAVATETPGNIPGNNIRVETDRYVAEISLTGGDLRRVELRGYAISKKDTSRNFALLDDRGGHLFILQSGLAGAKQPLATHNTVFTSAQASYRLADGADALDVPLEFRDAAGFTVRKTFSFRRGSYEIALTQTLKNESSAEVAAGPYLRFVTTAKPSGEEPPFAQTFHGLGIYEQKEDGKSYRFKKIKFKDLDDDAVEIKQSGGWIAVLQHYFLAAILPPDGEALSFEGKTSANKGYFGQYVGSLATVPAQAEKAFTTRLYIGPNLQGTVDKVAPGLKLTQDYGILTPIAEPLFWLLSWLHKLTHNWGVAIILLTLAVKGVMYKLSEAQYRSMAKMKKFGPRIQEIKERYSEDRERLNKAMMDLYKKEGFNPLAGCWPLLVQFPVFIALYWVLSQSVELRQADFALWINDLSSADPFYVLPVLFAASMFVQQKLSGQNASMDPMQQKIMSLMPVFMGAFFAFFPAGLVLYWFVSNLIGIAQQWVITRKLANEPATKR